MRALVFALVLIACGGTTNDGTVLAAGLATSCTTDDGVTQCDESQPFGFFDDEHHRQQCDHAVCSAGATCWASGKYGVCR